MEDELRKEIEEIIKGSLFQDSIEIGSASKTGSVKVYVDFGNKAEAEKKLDNAISILKAKRDQILESK